MKKIILLFLTAAAAIAFTGCARQIPVGVNDANKRYFDAWMQINHPEAIRTDLGIYILEDTPGTGAVVKKDGFARLDFKATDLEGNIVGFTDAETAKQLGTYSKDKYYGAKFQATVEGATHAGLLDALVGMQVGGHRKVVIPTWLMSYSTYKTEAEYLADESSNSSTIYDLTVTDFAEDIYEWQTERIGEYFKENNDIFDGMTPADSLPDHGGFYYKTITPAKSDKEFPKDTTIYINYTGKLLDGTVFDTTDETVAKNNGIWSSSRAYEPVLINWGEKYTDITMGSSASSIISGFSLTLWQMKAFEKGVGVFTSQYGYGYAGSGESIPGYSPLVFEIEIVAKPED